MYLYHYINYNFILRQPASVVLYYNTKLLNDIIIFIGWKIFYLYLNYSYCILFCRIHPSFNLQWLVVLVIYFFKLTFIYEYQVYVTVIVMNWTIITDDYEYSIPTNNIHGLKWSIYLIYFFNKTKILVLFSAYV